MKLKTQILFFITVLFYCLQSFADAVVMNPGKAVGQIVYLTVDDVKNETDKYKSLSPLSIPVFEELPMDLSVVAGVITLRQQNLLSHVQIKSRARRTPNLDISNLVDGFNNVLFANAKDGDFVEMELTVDGKISFSPSSEEDAEAFYKSKSTDVIKLTADLNSKDLMMMDNTSWKDFDKIGSKAANYAELATALNTPDRTIVRPAFGIPFYYYAEFIKSHPELAQEINKVIKDPLMKKTTASSYREKKLSALRDLILSDKYPVSEELIAKLEPVLDSIKDKNGKLRRMKFRSSTNAEDLPNFNGAGLYTSESYKPVTKKGKTVSEEEKKASLILAIKTVWASIWNTRAYEERTYFGIPHNQVYMGIQVNPSFGTEKADGVVVTKNVAGDPNLTGDGVYIEAQRGDTYSVANPDPGIKPQKILVLYSKTDPLNKDLYEIHVLQMSNIGDDYETILPHDNPIPVMFDEEIKDLVYQSLKAELHFKPLLGEDNEDFSLDLEFKVDDEETAQRQVYLKQSRPFIY